MHKNNIATDRNITHEFCIYKSTEKIVNGVKNNDLEDKLIINSSNYYSYDFFEAGAKKPVPGKNNQR